MNNWSGLLMATRDRANTAQNSMNDLGPATTPAPGVVPQQATDMSAQQQQAQGLMDQRAMMPPTAAVAAPAPQPSAPQPWAPSSGGPQMLPQSPAAGAPARMNEPPSYLPQQQHQRPMMHQGWGSNPNFRPARNPMQQRQPAQPQQAANPSPHGVAQGQAGSTW